jgi:hypothetical protein
VRVLAASFLCVGLSACATMPQSQAIVPVDLSSGRPVVQLTLQDGSTAPFIFDSGAMAASVSRAIVTNQRLPIIGKTRLSSPHGGSPIEADLVNMGRVSLGGVKLSNTQASSAVALDQFAPNGAGNIIGPANFSGKVIELNFETQTLRLGQRALIQPAVWMPLDQNGFLSGTTQIAGQRVPFTLDLGNPGAVVTSLLLAKSWNPNETWPVIGRMGTVDSTRNLSVGRFDRDIIIAGITLRVGTLGALDGAPAYLNLGSGALAGLTVVIDKPNKRWGLTGRPSGEVNMPLPRRAPPRAP